MATLLEQCRDLCTETPTIGDVARLLRGGGLEVSELERLAKPDPKRPYGRHVFLDSPRLEGMVATWTRDYPCAPHDHGGSDGAVLVLQGICVHRVWQVTGGRLTLVLEERKSAGDLLVCGPNLVHSMGDGGGEAPLMTLHAYVEPIDHMVVYDRGPNRTVVVDGGCGAWIPVDEPSLIRCSVDGMVTRSQLLAMGLLENALVSPHIDSTGGRATAGSRPELGRSGGVPTAVR